MRLGISAILFFAFVGLAAGQKVGRPELCSLFADDLASSGGKVVRIKAFMTMSTIGRVDGGEPFFYSPRCNNYDYFVLANFSNVREKHADKFLRNLPSEMEFVLELDITGTLHTSFVPKYGHLSWSRSEFRISKVHSISDATKRKDLIKPDYAAESPLSDLGNSIRSIDAAMTLYLLGDSKIPDLDSVLSPEFTVLDPIGRTYGRSEFGQMARDWLGDLRDHRSLTFLGVSVEGRVYTTYGTASVLDSAGVDRKFVYENIFLKADHSFVLLHSRFRTQ